MSFTLLNKRSRTAKKQHQCIWCGESILPGDEYRDERSIYDGRIQVHRWHPECFEQAHEENTESEWEFSPYDNERPGKPFREEEA